MFQLETVEAIPVEVLLRLERDGIPVHGEVERISLARVAAGLDFCTAKPEKNGRIYLKFWFSIRISDKLNVFLS
jgi:hypothetical protein